MVTEVITTGGVVKKKITIILGVMLFAPLLTGYELPSSETLDIKSYNDQYTLDKTFSVLEKKGSTYELGYRTVQIRIAPQKFRIYEQRRNTYEDRNTFHKVLVSIVLCDAVGKISQDFQSYLNYENCPESRGRLFWDHAGENQADRAGQSFTQQNPLIIEDEYFRVTVALLGFSGSPYTCDTTCDQTCESDSSCLYYLNILTLRVTTAYSSAQEELKSSFEEASAHAETASDFLQKGEFEKAKSEYEKAKAIYEQIDDSLRSGAVLEQLNLCNNYIDAHVYYSDGLRLFQEAANEENYKKAIEEYEDARSSLEKAQIAFADAGALQSEECQTWIDQCNNEIENLERVGRLRVRLLYVVAFLLIAAGAGGIVSRFKKWKTQKPEKDTITLKVQNAETGEEVTIEVNRLDKIGKIRQIAGAKLHIIPSRLLYNEEACPPDRTVGECGLKDGDAVRIVPMEKEVQDRIRLKLEQRYREGKVSREMYDSLRQKFDIKVSTPEENPRIVHEGRAYSKSEDPTTIGRDEKAGIQVHDPDKLVSRIHAKIYRDEGQYWIEDNNSVNGTFIYKDGKYERIEKCALHHGDTIVLSYDPERDFVTLHFKEN